MDKVRRLLGAFMGLMGLVYLGSVNQATAAVNSFHQSGAVDTLFISRTIGIPGTWISDEGVYKINIPRNDVKVQVDGISMPPFMGLTTWIGFQRDGESTMLMGDMVLFQDEVNSVMTLLLDGGINVTGLHNHFLSSEPIVFFMHIEGTGELAPLLKTIRTALDSVRSIRGEHPLPQAGPRLPANISSSDISSLPIEKILGTKGIAKDGMVKFVFGRSAKTPDGCMVGREMGVNTWAALMGSDEHAVIDGDFATASGELQPVLKSLSHSGINVVAIHNHMEGEVPRLIFLHYWGVGAAADLARDFKGALDAQSSAAVAVK